MTEGGLSARAHFTLSQELPVSLTVSSSDELEEEPLKKRIKISETNDPPDALGAFTPDASLDFDLLKDDSCHGSYEPGSLLDSLVDKESGNSLEDKTVPSPPVDETVSEGGEISSDDEASQKPDTEAETTKENADLPTENTKKPVKPKTKARKRRKSKLEPKDDPEEVHNSSSEDEDEYKSGDGTSADGQPSTKAKKRNRASHLRKNIREILSTNQLDEETLAAQREEQERRARVSQKLAQQQQQNLVQMLNTVTPSNHPFQLSQQIDKLFARKGVLPAPGLVPICTTKKSAPTVIDEVTLSSDDENPEVVPLNDSGVVHTPDLFRGLDHERRNGFNSFRNSGGTMKHFEYEPAGVNLDEKGPTDGGDSDSDDCVVLSPSAYQDEIEKEGKEDENNVPDDLGRVLVNVAHPTEDPDIFLAPQIARAVKPHQIGGIRFLYDNVVESLDRFNTSNGFGCILAHSMGLGKTIQAVSFCDIFLRHTQAKTVLIIVPINTIQNWLNEFDFWLPPSESVASSSFKLRQEKKPKGRKSTKTLKSMFSDSSSPQQQIKLEQPSSSAPSPTQSNASMSIEVEEENSRITNSDENSGSATTTSTDYRPRHFQVFVLNETVKTLAAREKIISDWNSQGGVLLLGYEMYRMLALKRLKRSSKKKLATLSLNDGTDVGQAEEQSLNRIYEYLVRPGPDLVICDEGHRIKNSGASISQALKAVRTRRRVVLTGYPLQNNLMEYWCMVDFVRPNYLGSKTEFSNMFERPITNGQCTDSSMSDRKLMRYRSHVLHTLLEGFVQRRSHQVLQSALPFKEEWVFLLKMTPIQYTLYKEFIRYLREEHKDKNADKDGSPTANPIKAFAVCCKIWNHPDALYNVVKKHEDVLDDLDMDDMEGTEDGPKKRKPRTNNRNSSKNPATSAAASPVTPISDFNFNHFNPDFMSLGVASMANIPATVGQPVSNPIDGRSISLDWASAVFKNYESELLDNGVKFQLLFAIVEEIQKVGDKLLVFSQSLLTLDLIELFLAKKFSWKKNSHYFRLDGSTSGLEREKLIYDFNDNENVHLFLVSTRAGSLGINLIGANRVVVFDASWNPCHDAQAVCRVYRYGQKKECQIYRFVTDCTLEKRIYDRQINKRGMSDRVVDEMNPEAHLQSKDVTSFLVLDQAQMDEAQNSDIRHKFDLNKFSDPVLKTVLSRYGDRLTREPFEHESLLIDRKESKLSAKEKRLARLNYEEEKKQSGNSYTRPSYSAFYPKPVENSNISPLSSSYPNNFSSNFNSFNQFNDNRMMNTASMSYREKMVELHQIQQKRLQQHVDLPYEILKERGIDVRFMNLKKDAFLNDPQTGMEMYLKAGEKISILRSPQGTYLRIGTNGSLIGIKPTSPNSNSYRGIPLVGDVSTTQLQALVYSLLRPAKSTSFYNPYVDPNSRAPPPTTDITSPYFNRRLGLELNKPPTMQKLPPTTGLFPSFLNNQITNFRSHSGGDVTILRSGPRKDMASSSKFPQSRRNNGSSNNNSDVEVIEFDEHFGETTNPRADETPKNIVGSDKVVENIMHPFNVTNKDSPTAGLSPSDSIPRNKGSGPSTPDVSILPIPASPSTKIGFLPHLDSAAEVKQKSVIRAGKSAMGTKSGSGSNENSNSNSNLSWEHSSGSDLSTNLTITSNINPSVEENSDKGLWTSKDSSSGISPSRAAGVGVPTVSSSINACLPFLEETLPPWTNSNANSRTSRSFLDSSLTPNTASAYDYNPRIAMQNLVRNFGGPASNGSVGVGTTDLIQNSVFKTRDIQFPPNSEIYGHFFDDINNSEVGSSTTNFNDFLGAGSGNGLSPLSHVTGSPNNDNTNTNNLMMNPGQYYGIGRNNVHSEYNSTISSSTNSDFNDFFSDN